MKRTVMLAAALFVAGFPVGSAHAQSDFRVTLTRPSQSSSTLLFGRLSLSENDCYTKPLAR